MECVFFSVCTLLVPLVSRYMYLLSLLVTVDACFCCRASCVKYHYLNSKNWIKLVQTILNGTKPDKTSLDCIEAVQTV